MRLPPKHDFSRSANRDAGILLPAFSPRRKGDLGIGDTLAMRGWIDWAADHHVSFIQLLPIHENGADESPYSAISSAALDPILLACDEPEIPMITSRDVAHARAMLGDAADAEQVDYPAVRRAKRTLLELAWSRFDGAAPAFHAEFADFRAAESAWLDDYCVFRHLCDVHGEHATWDEWPAGHQTPEGARDFIERSRRADAEAIGYRLGYFAFVQWLCHRQWRALRAHADRRGVRLMGDIPIGIARHSADVFFHRDQFHLDWCAGSPGEGHGHPDPFTARWGQNWGVPTYRWEHMAKDGYRWWKHRLARITEIFHIFRIDHILGFYRIYAFPWLPSDNPRFAHLDADSVAALTGGMLPRWWLRPDDTTENQAANLADGDRRLRGVLEGCADAEVIAEDLGWVPPYVRPHLANLGICGYRIPHWDCDSNGHPLPGAAFPEASFAAYSTHDHDPLCAIWRGCLASLDYHRHHPDSPDRWQADNAWNALRIFGEFAGIPAPRDGGSWPAYTEGIHLRMLKALLDCHSRHASIMITELFGLDARINTPGTHGHQNWRFRLPWTLDTILSTPALAETCAKFSRLVQASRRAPQRSKDLSGRTPETPA